MSKKKLYILLGILILAVVIAFLAFQGRSKITQYAMQPTETKLETLNIPAGTEQVVAENLSIPWEVAFLPDGTLLVTERTGTLKHITSSTTTINVEGVVHKGEGGLLGMALHPNFKDNHFIYLYSTTQTASGLSNRVERYIYDADSPIRNPPDRLIDRKILLENIPGSNNHDGGRMAFGPDGYLYITTGDAENSDNAQNINSLAGKILRIKDDGSIPTDNPFHNATYSYGHRNPQGIAWDDHDQLWATEHGPSITQSGNDELNKIEKGKNYGWPTIQGNETKEGLVTPIINSGKKETWAPSGLAFYNGFLIFSGLRGQSLYAISVSYESNQAKVGSLKTYLREKYGRLRAVVSGPDGFLYITTSNTDGRGTPKPNDDKIIRIKPNLQ